MKEEGARKGREKREQEPETRSGDGKEEKGGARRRHRKKRRRRSKGPKKLKDGSKEPRKPEGRDRREQRGENE